MIYFLKISLSSQFPLPKGSTNAQTNTVLRAVQNQNDESLNLTFLSYLFSEIKMSLILKSLNSLPDADNQTPSFSWKCWMSQVKRAETELPRQNLKFCYQVLQDNLCSIHTLIQSLANPSLSILVGKLTHSGNLLTFPFTTALHIVMLEKDCPHQNKNLIQDLPVI